MTYLLEFINGLLEGCVLIALSVSVGGIIFALFVLRAAGYPSKIQEAPIRLSLFAVLLGAGTLAFFRLAELTLKPWAIAGEMTHWALGAFFQTQFFQFGIISVLLSALLAVEVWFLLYNTRLRGLWVCVFMTAVLFLVNEGGLSHAASRVEGPGPLMAVTVIHLTGAIVWAGGMIHLTLLWWFVRQKTERLDLWPEWLSRFSPIGVISVALIVFPGLWLTWNYVGSWEGFIGTSYGNMVTVKVVLFMMVFVLATLNFFNARIWRKAGGLAKLDQRVPAYVEVELILATALLFSASTLTSFPPTVDVEKDLATPAEIWNMFSPKIPRVSGPERILIEAPEFTDLVTGKIGWKEDVSWDRFNHNISGVIVLFMAALALLDRLGGFPWARHWPLVFVAFAILVIVFANPDHWPLGPASFGDSMQNTTVVQHWLAGLIIFGLGVFEWRARVGYFASMNLRFVFPILCIAGGIVLITHSHNTFELKREFLTQSTHVFMGLLGVLLGCSRWLELRLPPPQERLASVISITCIILVGLVLLFYIRPVLPEI